MSSCANRDWMQKHFWMLQSQPKLVFRCLPNMERLEEQQRGKVFLGPYQPEPARSVYDAYRDHLASFMIRFEVHQVFQWKRQRFVIASSRVSSGTTALHQIRHITDSDTGGFNRILTEITCPLRGIFANKSPPLKKATAVYVEFDRSELNPVITAFVAFTRLHGYQD